METLLRTTLNIGIDSPVKILFAADAHMTYTNDLDSDEHKELEKIRTGVFYDESLKVSHTPEYYFREAIKIAEDEDALLVLGGDMIDIQTNGNIEMFNSITEGHDMMFTPGGHEHQKRCVRTVSEPDGFFRTSRAKLKKLLPRFDLDFDSRIINGVNIITADSSLDYFNERTLERFKEELAKGLPCVVFSHDPLTDPYLIAEEEQYRYKNLTEKEYEISHEMYSLLENSPLVKAYFCGHYHLNHESRLNNGNPHIITHGLFAGVARLIEII